MLETTILGAIAQLGERFPCTEEVCGSIPHSSTTFFMWIALHLLPHRDQKEAFLFY